MTLTYKTYQRDKTQQPSQMVILLHGFGSNADDLLSLGVDFSQTVPNAVFIAPNAPFPCEMGGFGFQWFSLADYTMPKLLAGARMAHEKLDAFVQARLQEFGMQPSQLVVGGFSQGCMMSLFWGLRQKQAVAGILGYSGMIIGHDELAAEIQSRPPVCLVHGALDTVVPSAQLEASREALEALEVPVEAHRREYLMHSIDFEGLDIGAQFLQRVLG